MMDMDDVDKATVIRGYELRTHDMQWMIRWLGSLCWVAPGNKSISAEKLLKLRCDRKGKAPSSQVKKKLEESQSIFDLWDATPTEQWKTEVIK